ncbi:MAG: peptidase S10 [Acidimicrobiia bacterium]|nr:peptidase S10 [Acidimicrobiia bacterium]
MISLLLVILLAAPTAVFAQRTTSTPPPASAPAASPAKPAPDLPLTDTPPVVTDHQMQVGGRTLRYKATTGMMAMKTESGEMEANMFFVAYTVDAPAGSRRPLTVCFNGGPGAGSLWLHLGAIGPKRARMNDDGSLPPPPYQLPDNEHTWLEHSDLVFVDPVGTGYSRARNPEVARKFFGVRGDIESVGQFVRLFLTRFDRWDSPLFIAGESYGTTRAAGLSQYLADHGIGLNGVILISAVMNFQTLRFAPGNDTPYPLYLPTYTATAWYHKKLPADLQKDLQKAIEEARQYASGPYVQVLQKGDLLSAEEYSVAVKKLARLTGLSESYIRLANLRPEIQRFCKELLRPAGKTVGRLDSRLTGIAPADTAEQPEFDPSMTAIRPPYTAMMNAYARMQLKFSTDWEYFALGGGITSPWNYDLPGGQGYADTSVNLKNAMAKNPHTKVFIGSGFYDLATPFHAVEYTISHLGLDPALRSNIRWAEYEAGHMMYIHLPSLEKLKHDISGFYRFALRQAGSGSHSTASR